MPAPFLPPPERCEPLAGLVARWDGAMEMRSAAEVVEYALPSHASAELREFWHAETRAEAGPAFIARLPQGRVFGSGIVLSPDGRSIARDVSLDFGKPPTDHWLVTHRKIPPPQPLPGRTAVVATTLGMGYGHWLLDELPRLLTLPRAAADAVIAHADEPCNRMALDQTGWSGAVLPADRRSHFQCEHLIVPSLVGTVVQPTRAAVDLLHAFTARYHSDTSTCGARLYLSRETARRRRVTNESALWAELEPAGFVKVRLEKMTWPEQINAFRHAKVIVAPHGAGLANLAFCRPGTRVIELFNRAYVSGCYWRLAALQGLDYRPVLPESPGPLGATPECNRLDLEADLAQVRAALRGA